MGRDEQWAGFELQARGGLTSFWLGWAEPQMGDGRWVREWMVGFMIEGGVASCSDCLVCLLCTYEISVLLQ